MTKEQLSQLTHIKTEIDDLQKRIDEMQALYDNMPIVHDKVQASMTEHPYIQSSANISGQDEESRAKIRNAIRKKYALIRDRQAAAAAAEAEIMEYINTISDSRIRQMFTFKYIDNMTWAEIGTKMHCERSTAEKTVERYLKRH
jgi:DNA-directed RNA polymerase specialized sigma24 family protein